jgi:hypothetical protein
VPIKPENQRLSASICVQILAPKANPEFCQSTSELIAADPLNHLYSLSYSANCRPTTLDRETTDLGLWGKYGKIMVG